VAGAILNVRLGDHLRMKMKKNQGEMMNIFVNRMIRAARLDVSLYEEVEADRSAFRQAMTVVLISWKTRDTPQYLYCLSLDNALTFAHAKNRAHSSPWLPSSHHSAGQ
jgi:hypothetical protein